MKAKITVILITLGTFGAWIYAHSYKLPPAPMVELVATPASEYARHEVRPGTQKTQELQETEDSLYRCAHTICTRLMQRNAECFNVVDEETVETLKAYEEPRLCVLISALNQLQEDGDLSDIYDDDESTLAKYDAIKAKYYKLVLNR